MATDTTGAGDRRQQFYRTENLYPPGHFGAVVALRNAIKEFPVVVPVVSDKPRHTPPVRVPPCAPATRRSVWAVPYHRTGQSSSSKSATSLHDQTSFVLKVRHFRDSPSKRKNYLHGVTFHKTRIFNLTYRSSVKVKV